MMQLEPELTLEKATNMARRSAVVKKQQVTLRIPHEEKVDRVVMPLENNRSQRSGKQEKGKNDTVSFQFTKEQKCLFEMWLRAASERQALLT